MPKTLFTRWHGLHTVWTFAFMLVSSALLYLLHWLLGTAALFLCGFLAYYTITAEKAFRKEMNEYVATLSHRIKKASSDVMHELPIGILLYNEERAVEWHNPFVAEMLAKESVIGYPVVELFPALKSKKEKDGKHEVVIGAKTYQVIVKAGERLLFFTDISAYTGLTKRYEEEKLAIGILMLDNLDEATQGMDDQSRSVMLAKVTGHITEWAAENGVFLRRTASDKYLLMMSQKTLRKLEQTKFDLLDDVRDITADYKLPLTISVGVGTGADGLVEMGQLAQMGLDIALGRGGDQVAVRHGQRVTFYGGRSNAVEKRTRVRARVIAHALRDLIRDSDKVVIMGHKIPDMDSIGAAVGVLKAVQAVGKEGYIVLEGVNPSIYRLMELIGADERLNRWFISPEQALHITTQRSLAVVVDTHKASMATESKVLGLTNRVVVVDHHRRGEEFIDDAMLVYLEPYASSTCELVSELLQYISEHIEMEPLEATALLAGIVVDTKSFSLRTGARTFEAASFLRRNGADSGLVQKLLQEDLEQYMKKAEIIKQTEVIHEHIALAATEPGRKYSQLLIAQVADTLLNMKGILASFVICERTDGLIGISARSFGQINVQVIMERLGGGGHLTNAAVQLEGSIEEAEERLKQVLQEMEEEGLFE
ncbi:DHH family phosphoesterase [Paenibacillus turpanensis]|uniref:DHH family phosphoesterase n=1 Tax=Paenibacillus turpanensis TaxID=2689078 RepID=UPI00140BC6FB|nr:DHH family phosphoesterase [Paenibacillus turpanensis]